MAASLPDASTRWRCGGCGNLTRFDVTRTRRTTEFWHFDLAGDHVVEESRDRPRGRRARHLPLVRTVGRDRAVVSRTRRRPPRRERGRGGHAVLGPRTAQGEHWRRFRRGPDPGGGHAADALGRMPADTLPASLRRVATFAPARRARLAATQIASVLATDEAFRERVATQVRAQVPELATALDEGVPPEAADPAELAAVAYLLRSPGWTDVVAAAQQVVAERDQAERPAAATQLDRLHRQLAAAIEELKDTKARNRERVAELKAENADLRHKLGDARERARSAEARATAAGEEVAALQGVTRRRRGGGGGRVTTAAGEGRGARARAQRAPSRRPVLTRRRDDAGPTAARHPARVRAGPAP